MAVDWIKEDGTFTEDWVEKANLPADVKDYAKGVKDIGALVKRGVDTQREFTARVKIPDRPEDRQKFLNEHFKTDLEAREADRKKAEEEAAKTAKTQQDAAAVEAEKKRAEAAEKTLRDKHGAEFEKKLELVRRAFRSDHVSPEVKATIAKSIGVELDKLTDEQIKAAFKADPVMFEIMLSIASLSQDGRTEHGDGHVSEKREAVPMQPKCPQLYKNRPDSDPEKQWFVKRGFDFATMTWNGQPV